MSNEYHPTAAESGGTSGAPSVIRIRFTLNGSACTIDAPPEAPEPEPDSGLTPSTTYSYTVQARDQASVPNETAPSSPLSATTFASSSRWRR